MTHGSESTNREGTGECAVHEPTRRIFRYKVPVDDQLHEFSLSGAVLSVGCRSVDHMEFWALESGGPTIQRAFIVVGTGHPWPPDTKYVGTAVAPGGVLVWHLLEAQ